MSFRSSSSHDTPMPSTGEIIRSGVLKKAKSSRKKYFVLRAETADALARLEYYDSEKKYRAGQTPKRIIPLKTCFNINRKQDSKHKHVIALYTKDDCFCVAFETDDDLKIWLKDFLTLQHGEEIPEGEVLKPKFEFVWQVKICDRGLGIGRTGLYRLCLTERTLTLLKIDEPFPTLIELSLTSVRTCGNLKNFFYLEVGRSSEIGAGEIWFDALDTNIAMSIQTTVTHRFKLARERSQSGAAASGSGEPGGDFQPKGRIRSASATESSKSATKKFNPIMSSKLPPQGGGTGWSSGTNHQRTQSLPLATPFGAAPSVANSTIDNPTSITLTNHPASIKKIQGAVGGGKCSFRDRCDSMPSRPRTTSEGNHHHQPYAVPFRGHLRDASHSPVAGSPISPPSDSTGSSYSLADDHDVIHEMEHQRLYSTMTPDEPIVEEDYPESPRASAPGRNYVSMTPQGIARGDEYMEMNLGGPQHNHNSNSASMSSVTSGTPVGDMMRDYPLDKVFSYVSAEEDDTRPGRAYSLGSKPTEPQLASTPENRQRACSVGSKNKKYFNRVFQPHHHTPGIKSSSAPLLAPNSRVGSSHSSINNPMDDLMEMDFSYNSTNRSRSSTNGSSSSCNHKNSSCNGPKNKILGFLENWGVVIGGDREHKKSSSSDTDSKHGTRTVSGSSDYMDIVTVQPQRLRPDIDVNVSSLSRSTAPFLDSSGNGRSIPLVGHPFSPYMDMRNGSNANRQQQNNDPPPYLNMSGGGNAGAASAAAGEEYMDMSGSSPHRGSPQMPMSLEDYARLMRRPFQEGRRQDYMDMSQGNRANSNSSTNSRPATSPGVTADHNTDYLDMSGRNRRASPFGAQMSTSPNFDVSPRFTDPFEVPTIPEGQTTETEGYVEMTPGDLSSIQPSHQRQNRTGSVDNNHGDYLNMSGINVALTATKSDSKARSDPIAIQPRTSTIPLSISGLLGRKSSPPTRGSPKMHLPISPYSSLPRQKSPRKGSASQASSSKDSSLSSSVTTTPSSSSVMFPMSLNSPQSPLADVGTPTAVSMKVLTHKPSGTKKKVSTEDYTMMDFESSKPSNEEEESPYVNYCPPGGNTPARVPQLNETDDYSGDYAVMKPGVFPVKPSTLPRVKHPSSSGLTSPLANHLSTVGLNEVRPNMCFMPIKEKEERMASPKPGDVPDKLVQVEKTLETANMECESKSQRTYDRLRSPTDKLATKLPRPGSLNSDGVNSSQSQRPSSTTGSEKNSASRPSPECSEGLTSRLGSSSSVYSSSSSTSTVIAAADVQSTINPEPQQIVRLHYASLDLSPADPSENRSPRASSENNLNDGQTTTFVYADIDFIRSEELRTASANDAASSTNNNSSAVVN